MHSQVVLGHRVGRPRRLAVDIDSIFSQRVDVAHVAAGKISPCVPIRAVVGIVSISVSIKVQ